MNTKYRIGMGDLVPVICYDLLLNEIGRYKSITEATKKLKIGKDERSGKPAISGILSGKQKTVYSRLLGKRVTFKKRIIENEKRNHSRKVAKAAKRKI